MNCPKCNTPMVISEWDGWVWMCFHCDYTGRLATDEEVREYEDKSKQDDKGKAD